MTAHDVWPIDPSMVWPFLVAVALVELTPGPNMVWLAVLTLAQGRVAGVRAVAGVTLGLSVYMLAAVVGVAGAMAAAPGVYAILRMAGVAYLLWLAWDAWRGAAETVVDPGRAPFWRGLVANLLNPKAAVFYVTLLPGFIQPDHAPFWAQALLLGIVHIAVAVLVHLYIVLAAQHVAGYIGVGGETARAIMLRRMAAVGIGLVAIWLWWETRR
ncbi:MAG: LysE family translocator [Alphaproteobacteria bacterium]|nr:LysE family translocator [Alphaproteobacteria bacterium]